MIKKVIAAVVAVAALVGFLYWHQSRNVPIRNPQETTQTTTGRTGEPAQPQQAPPDTDQYKNFSIPSSR